MRPYYFLFIVTFFIFSCQDEKIFFVADHLGDCEETCLLVRENTEDDWTSLLNPIEGFDYEQGYEYQIKVKIEKNEHDSSLKYTLLDVLAKTKKDQNTMKVIEGKEWIVKQLVNFENKTDTYPHFMIKDGQINGNSGCNTFGGSLTSDGKNSFSIGVLRMTKMYCENSMDLEKAFSVALKNASKFKLDNNMLHITNANGDLLFSASEKSKTITIENKWFVNTLKGFNNTTGQIPHFSIKNGQINGNNGCNNFGGDFITDESGLFQIGMLRVTKRYCEEYTALEKAFHKTLENAVAYKITDGSLFLLDKSDYIILSSSSKNTEDESASYMPYIIEYNTYSRSFAIRNKVMEEKNSLYYHNLHPEKTEEQKVVLSKSELLFFSDALKTIDFKEIENLVPPSTEHQHDGAPGATLIVNFEEKSYRVPTFDHGNPPIEIKEIVDKIMDLRSK